MMYERLYKMYADDTKVCSAFASAWTDPALWTVPEGGFWIESEPKLVRTEQEMALFLKPGEEIPVLTDGRGY